MLYQLEKVIGVDKWDSLVMETYKRPYNFQQQDGCKERHRFHIKVPDKASDYENENLPEKVDSVEMGVSFESWLNRDPEQKIPATDNYCDFTAIWWERKFYPDVQMVANDLYSKGLIEAGEYVIDIDW